MIEVTVKDIFKNMAAVNEEAYVKPAMAAYDGLHIYCIARNEHMWIPPDKVHKWYARSQIMFKDKYGGPGYYLVYYTWAPTAKQELLL